MMSSQKPGVVRLIMAVSLFALFAGIISCSGDNAEKMFKQGIDAMAADNPNEAEIWFKKALQKDPELAVAHYKLGEVYRKKGNVKLAYAELSRAILQNPQLKDARKELIFLLVENRALKQAGEACEQYLEVSGDDEEIYLILGNSLAYTKNVDKAVDVLRKGLAVYPENKILEMNLAKMLVVRGDVQEGRSMMEKLAIGNPDDVKVQIALAQMYEKLERYDLAVTVLEGSKENFPENPLPYLALAQLSLKKNQPESAKKIILEAEEAGARDSRLYRMYAMISHRQGKSDEALLFFEKSVEAATDEIRIVSQMILADYHTFLKNYKEAQQILETIIATDASQKGLKSKVVALFMAQGKFDQARSSVDSLLKEDSGDARGHFLKGLMMMQDEEVTEARKEFSQAKELAPNAAENQFLYGMTFMKESDQISITEINEALKKNPKLFRARLALAELYARKGDFQQSLDELDKILSRQGEVNQLDKATAKQADNLKVRALRISLLMKLNKPEDALNDAKLLAELQPDKSEHTFRVAEIYYSMKKLDDALPLYEKLQQEKPDSAQLLNRIVGALMLKKENDKAMAVADAFLAKNPQSINAIIVKAKIYLSQGYDDLAENILAPEAAKGEDVAPIVMLAELYGKKNDVDHAVKFYLQALELIPENLGIQMKLADFYLKSGNNEEAIGSYEKVLKLKSGFLPAMNNLAFLYTEENKNLDRALELANEVSRKLPDNPDVADTLGWIYVMKKVYSQAEPNLLQAIDAKPDNPLVVYHMAMLRYAQRKLHETEELLERAVKNGLSGKELTRAEEILSTVNISKNKLIAAKAEKEQGRAEKAITMLEELRNSAGFTSEAAADLGMLYAEQNKDITVALELAQRAYDDQPENPHFADALGWVYFYQGSVLMAKQFIEQALKNNENYGPAHVHLGAVFLKKEELDAARKELASAETLKLSPADQKQLKKLRLKLGK